MSEARQHLDGRQRQGSCRADPRQGERRVPDRPKVGSDVEAAIRARLAG